jgi:MtN3 and saliva related transmembrane protein
MEAITVIGFIAASCTTISFLPQVIKTLKTKQTKDISMLMYLILLTGLTLWLIYGLIIKDDPIIFANGITLILAGIVFVLKIKYK